MYGILIVEGDEGLYMPLGEVVSYDEAKLLAHGYERAASPDHPQCNIPPQAYMIRRRDANGWYSIREQVIL